MNKIEIVYKTPDFQVSEEIKTLRTRIQFCGEDKKVFVMTSSLPKEGKSVLSLDLAVSLSKLQKKVLYLDLDLRKSVFFSKVKTGHLQFGMTHFLLGQCTLKDVIYATNFPKLYVIYAGPSVKNSTELLQTEQFEKTMKALRNAYDAIIIDTPPLGLVIDAAVISKHCDGAIVVVQEGRIKYRLAQETVQKLRNSGCEILGGILSHASKQGFGKYYGREYRYYKNYGYNNQKNNIPGENKKGTTAECIERM